MSSATSPIFSFLSQYQEEQALPSSASMTPEEYHAFLPLTPRKYEYHEGKAVLMAGASPEPNLIAKNLLVALDVALESLGSDCDVFGSDQKVYVSRRKILLPDVIVACEPLQVDENDCLRNPVLTAEVLSPSTASYDENDKFRDYRALPTLCHYVTVRQDRAAVLHYARTEGGLWSIVGDHTALDAALTVDLGGKNVSLPLARLYRRIALAPYPDE